VFDDLQRHAFKKVVLRNNAASGLGAVIAIHSTTLAPANGGVRMWR
jgi:leucine dehydrogenase